MRIRLRHLLLVVVAAASFLAAFRSHRQLVAAFPDTPAAIEGTFPLHGDNADAPPRFGATLRRWGSFAGSDQNVGIVRVGPFPASHRLRFGVSGYPGNAGNSLYVERTDTQQRVSLTLPNPASNWLVVDAMLPDDWRGKPVRLVAVDHDTAFTGWLAITEPVRGGAGEGNTALYQTLAAALVNGLLLSLLWFAAVRFVDQRRWVPAAWSPLVAAGFVASLGYLLFWAYFASPIVGRIGSVVAVAAAVIHLWRTQRRRVADDSAAEFRSAFALVVGIGLFYLTLLHLFPSSREFYNLAANRLREELPGDNTLPHNAAMTLYAGGDLRADNVDWLTSDRPPLQTGWQLITLPFTEALGVDSRTATGTSSVWLQMLWVPAVFGLLRTLGVPRRRAAAWSIVLALSGFLAQNTLFTWPKLSAAAFGCGAFALWVLVRRKWERGDDILQPEDWRTLGPRRPRRGRDGRIRHEGVAAPTVHIERGEVTPPTLALGAMLAGLAWLSHGGIAFSFLALAPWVLWRVIRGEWRGLAVATAVFLAFALPWFGFQKLYNPPGDRLIKMHLGGQQDKDPRGAWTVIKSAYAAKTRAEIIENKVTNFRFLTLGHWGGQFEFDPETSPQRKNDEFFCTGRALTWWWLGIVALPLGLLKREVRERFAAVASGESALLAWTLATIVIWCLLMFGPYATSIHQGSYASMLALFVVLSVALEVSAPWWILVVGGLQLATFVTTWAWPNALVNGAPVGWPWLALTSLALLIAFVSLCRAELAAQWRAAVGAIGSAVARVHEGKFRVVVAAILLALFALRKPWALLHPQLWAEDGSIFLTFNDLHGLHAFVEPYMGYLHTIPRIVAWLASHLLDPRWWPAFYNWSGFLISAAVILRTLSSRLAVPGKIWLALAFFLGPQTGEVFFTVTNIQWFTGVLLIEQAFVAAPTNLRQRVSDLAIVLLAGLTGPFVIAFWPLLAWRWWRDRNGQNLAMLAAATLCAFTQGLLVLRTGPHFDWPPFAPARFFEILGQHFFAWPLVGRQLATQLPPVLLALVGLLPTVALLGWALRPDPLRHVRGTLVAAFVLITVALIYRSRPDTWNVDNLDFGERYFFIPRLLLFWLLILEFEAASRLIRCTARSVALVIVVVNLPGYATPTPLDLDWAGHCDPIRRGIPANIPTLPEGWTLEYRGRPGNGG